MDGGGFSVPAEGASSLPWRASSPCEAASKHLPHPEMPSSEQKYRLKWLTVSIINRLYLKCLRFVMVAAENVYESLRIVDICIWRDPHDTHCGCRCASGSHQPGAFHSPNFSEFPGVAATWDIYLKVNNEIPVFSKCGCYRQCDGR